MRPAKVTRIPTIHIKPNPHNPRRLFDEEPLKILRESIEKLGILVPITVYRETPGPISNVKRDWFLILDGERRWRCAKKLRQRTIPAIIIDQPSEETNILTMFHIHNLREGWQLMPTALKLRTLIHKLRVTNDEKLSELTKLSITQVRRCKILLTYPIKFQNMMLAPPDERMKSDFFIELYRVRAPALKRGFPAWSKRGDPKCIQIMLKKYRKGVISNVTDFRILTEIYRGSVKTNQLSAFNSQLEKLLSMESMKIQDVHVPGATFEKEYRQIAKNAEKLRTQLQSIEPEVLAASDNAVRSLRELKKLIQSKLDEALLVEPRLAKAKSS